MGQSNSTRGKSKSLGPSVEILCRDCTQQHMATLLEMLKRINQCTSLSQAVHKAIESTTALLDCDRATMFIVDEITDQLVVRDASGSTVDIKIPMTAGIAGSVYTGGELFNIPDAYKEPKFNKDTDKKTGYTTKSILACPVYNHDGTTVAVLQAINKKKEGNRGEVRKTSEAREGEAREGKAPEGEAREGEAREGEARREREEGRIYGGVPYWMYPLSANLLPPPRN